VWRTPPIKSETKVAGAGPFGGDGVEGLEGGVVMLDVFATSVLDSEIIDDQTEEDRTGRSIGEETGSMLCRYVAEFGEMVGQGNR
jgi:hypothetical protein